MWTVDQDDDDCDDKVTGVRYYVIKNVIVFNMFISECFKTRYILVPTAKLRLALWTKVLQ